MPVTGLRSRNHETVPEHSATMGLGHINTTSFLFGDDEDSKESTTSPDVKNYLQMNATDDKFPILVRRNEYPGVVRNHKPLKHLLSVNGLLQLSASSAALDLALSQSPGTELQDGWSPFGHHRLSQQQENMQTLSNGQLTNADSPKAPENMSNARQMNRHSMEASLPAYGPSSQPGQGVSTTDSSRPSLANVHSSYSTNDVPTLKKSNGLLTNATPPKTQAQQQFHNHNASLGRIPSSAISNRHSRELSGGDARREEQISGYQQMLSGPQASAAPFGPPTTAASPVESSVNLMSQLTTGIQFQNQAYFPGYGLQMTNMGVTPMHMPNSMTFPNQMQGFQLQNGFPAYPNYGSQGRFQDSQARIIQQRRMQNGEGIFNHRILTSRCSQIFRDC